MSDVQTCHSVSDWKCILDREEKYTAVEQNIAPAPQERPWAVAQYPGSPSPLLASPVVARRGSLAAVLRSVSGVLAGHSHVVSIERMQKAIRNTFHTHSFKFQPGPGRWRPWLQLHSPPPPLKSKIKKKR